MLRPPYSSYSRLYVYHLDMARIPKFDEPDLIGVWIEDETAVLFFHRDKDAFVADLCAGCGCTVIYRAELYYSSGFTQSMEAELLAEFPTDKVRFLDRKRSENWYIWVLGNRDVMEKHVYNK